MNTEIFPGTVVSEDIIATAKKPSHVQDFIRAYSSTYKVGTPKIIKLSGKRYRIEFPRTPVPIEGVQGAHLYLNCLRPAAEGIAKRISGIKIEFVELGLSASAE